jgi:hypothetical protein
VHRTPFLAHQDVAQCVLLEERVVNRQNRTARIAENDIDALIHQGFDDDIRSTDRLGRHDMLQSTGRWLPRRAPWPARGTRNLIT